MLDKCKLCGEDPPLHFGRDCPVRLAEEVYEVCVFIAEHCVSPKVHKTLPFKVLKSKPSPHIVRAPILLLPTCPARKFARGAFFKRNGLALSRVLT